MRVLFSRNKTKMVTPTEALPGREHPAFAVPERHAVLGTPLEPPFPEGTSAAVFGLEKVSYRDLLAVFWEAHDPTQGMRQGNDKGTQYRSAIYYADDEQRRAAEETRDGYEEALKGAGYGPITTEIAPIGPFYYAEAYHQQYLHKVPNGYCGMGGTGVSCPIGLGMGA